MKKQLALLLTLLLVPSVVSCGNAADETTADTAANVETVPEETADTVLQ